MHIQFFKGMILCLLFMPSMETAAQKDIILSDSLSSQAQKLKVKMGPQWLGKISKFSFGDYAIASSKMGWKTTTTSGNLFDTKTESKSTEKFSFVMINKKTNDSAMVNAANNIEVQLLHEIQITPHFSWGSNELLMESRNFSAYITINGDTSETWALFMNITRGSKVTNRFDGLLTNGEREIFLSPVNSDNNGSEKRPLPALGYEFIENDHSICALQYYGGGLLGLNKNIVWIPKQFSDQMKLLLASVCTAILQNKVNSIPD